MLHGLEMIRIFLWEYENFLEKKIEDILFERSSPDMKIEIIKNIETYSFICKVFK